MKAKYLGTAVLALALAGCGGKASFTVGGSIANLTNPGLVLANGDDTVSVPVGATSYSFPNQIGYGDAYDVVVKEQPQHMTCDVSSLLGSSGTAGRTETIDVSFSCSQNTYSVIATITGMTAAGLVVTNGTTTSPTQVANATTLTFPGIPVGVAYGLAVLEQPTGLTCTITNGTGVMGDANRADVVIACVPNT